MVQKIILVFKTHFDIGFTDLAERVIENYGGGMLRQVLETCRATRHMGDLRYVWTMPAWPLWYITQHCAPELRPELEQCIREGQIVWHGLPFTSHTDICAPEEYAQGLRYARELSLKYGKPFPKAAKMTDVPGHGRMLPDLLAQAGIRFLHLGCNEFAAPPDVPELFFWQGPGGGRVLTMYSKGGYGTGLLPPADWPYPVWMALMHTHDNCGPQSAALIEKMVRKAKAACPAAEIVCGTMDQFYEELAQCDLGQVPLVDKDLADTWIHGAGSYPAEVSQLRENRERARRLHGLYFAHLASGGPALPRLETLWNRYYEATALFEEHTWGADVKTWLGPDRVYEKEDFLAAKATPPYEFMERSWQEQRQRMTEASACLEEIEALLAGPAEPVLFHTGPAPYTGWVTLPQGRAYVEQLPPLTAAPIPAPTESTLRARPQNGLVRVENHRYYLDVDPVSGQIEQLFDKAQNAALLRRRGALGVFAYRYDRYGYDDINEFLRTYGYHFTTWGIQDYGRENYPVCPHARFAPVLQSWEISGDQICFRYQTGESSRAYGDAQSLCLTVTLPAAGEELFVELRLCGKQETPFVESGSLVLPLPGAVEYRIGKPGGAVDPKTEIQTCANHALFNLEQEVTVWNAAGGLTVRALDTPLFSIGSPGVYEYHREFPKEKQPDLWFDLFNNMWGTNFPQWTGGSFRYRFALSGCAGDKADGAMVLAASRCQGVSLTSLPLSVSGVTLPRDMALVHTQVEDRTLYLTLRDLSGKAAARTLEVQDAQLQAVDLFHRPVGEARTGSVVFPVRPYGLHVFALRAAK